jgi:magnesium transporter
MLNFYKTIDNRVVPIEVPEDGSWICAISPNEEEISYLTDNLQIDPGFVRAALDEEESSRVEKEEDQTLVIVDVPVAEKQDENTIVYSTMPFGIIVTPKHLITVSLRQNSVISEISDGLVKNVQTHLKTRFLLTMLLRIAVRFLQYLKQIDKISSQMERQLHKSMRNKELIQLLGLEKSLVYFSTSLKANETTMEKILRGRLIKLYEEDQDLLEDVLIETKQAIEMCNIYSSILSGTMDAFASIISNNLNIVMKIMTSVTIVMAIPNMISGFYGMNVERLPMPYFWFPLALSILAMVIAAIILMKKNMFR